MKKTMALVLALLMLLALTACGSGGKYEAAVELLEQGQYDEAKDIFEELGDYEDSADMMLLCDYEKAGSLEDEGDYEAALEIYEKLGRYSDCQERAEACRYGMAVAWMDDGDLEEALAMFEELGDYEDSPERMKACRYAMALEAYEQGDAEAALALFRELGDYEDSAAYRSDMSWDVLRSYILENGTDSDGMFILRGSEGDYTIYVAADEAEDHLYLFAFSTNNVLAEFYHDLMIDVVKGEETAQWQSLNTMVMSVGGRTGTNEENRSGSINLAACDGESADDLVLESYSKYAVDIYGNVTSSSNTADASMNDTNSHYYALMRTAAAVLEETGLGIGLADIGFVNLG